MVRNSTFCLGCGLVAAIPAVPFVLLVVASVLARYIPIDDPLFQNALQGCTDRLLSYPHWEYLNVDLPRGQLLAAFAAKRQVSPIPLGGL